MDSTPSNENQSLIVTKRTHKRRRIKRRKTLKQKIENACTLKKNGMDDDDDEECTHEIENTSEYRIGWKCVFKK